MPFIETISDYEAKVRKFAEEHPDATEADLKALFPKMNNHAAIWSRFNASAKRNGGAKAPAGVAE